MKKIFALVSAAILLFAAVGCTKKVNNGDTAQVSTSAQSGEETATEKSSDKKEQDEAGGFFDFLFNRGDKAEKTTTEKVKAETTKKGYLTTITVPENAKSTKPAETMLVLTTEAVKQTAKPNAEKTSKNSDVSAAVTAKPKDTTYTTQKYTLPPTTVKPTTTKTPFVAPKVRFKSQIVCKAGEESVTISVDSYKAVESKGGAAMLSFAATASGTVEKATSVVIYANCYDSSGGLIQKVSGYVAVKTSGEAAGLISLPAKTALVELVGE